MEAYQKSCIWIKSPYLIYFLKYLMVVHSLIVSLYENFQALIKLILIFTSRLCFSIRFKKIFFSHSLLLHVILLTKVRPVQSNSPSST